MDENCALCGNTKHMKKPKTLYEHTVCKKCYNSFACYRQVAFVVDMVLFRIAYYTVCFAAGMVLGLVGAVSDESIGLTVLAITGVMCGVFLFRDSIAGASIGKLLCGVR